MFSLYFFSLCRQKMCHIMILLSGNEMIYMGIWVQPYRPAPGCYFASALCLSPRPQMCFFQTLRPTESHSQTPSYWGTNKPSQNFFSTEQRTHKNNEQTIRTCQGGRDTRCRGRLCPHFCCDQNWTVDSQSGHETWNGCERQQQSAVCSRREELLDSYVPVTLHRRHQIPVDPLPALPPKRMSFPLASGLYHWSQMAESWAATSRYQSAHE